MPRGDRTGPNGMGPMTGRRMGYCAGFNAPGFTNSGFGGRGMGRGRAWRNGNSQPRTAPQTNPQQPVQHQDEKDALKQELKNLEEERKQIEERLKQIE